MLLCVGCSIPQSAQEESVRSQKTSLSLALRDVASLQRELALLSQAVHRQVDHSFFILFPMYIYIKIIFEIIVIKCCFL